MVISRSKRRNAVLIGAALVSLIALVMSVVWPNAIGRFFKVDTSGLGSGSR